MLRVHHAVGQLAPLIGASKHCTMVLAKCWPGGEPRVLEGSMSGLTSASQAHAVRGFMTDWGIKDPLLQAWIREARRLRDSDDRSGCYAARRSDFCTPEERLQEPFAEFRRQIGAYHSAIAISIVTAKGMYATEYGLNVNGEDVLLVLCTHRAEGMPDFQAHEVERLGDMAKACVPGVIDGADLPVSPHATELAAKLTLLTERQRELLPYLSRGLSEREIAQLVFRSTSTVHTHVRRIYEVLVVRNRIQLFNVLANTPRPESDK